VNSPKYGPNNAIECWCDGNQFIDNIASHSNFGLWLGGTDRGVVRGNAIDGNVVDGISIQIGENRHTLIEDNVITNSGRAGILLTGREYQAGADLYDSSLTFANLSLILVQRNSFSGDAVHDIFATSTRSLVLASNCSVVSQHFGEETDVVADSASAASSPRASSCRSAPR
jgi:parallel beta-helix repeat protein